eukprot:jgi/Tetstr1/453722/TSEL_040678.t1
MGLLGDVASTVQNIGATRLKHKNFYVNLGQPCCTAHLNMPGIPDSRVSFAESDRQGGARATAHSSGPFWTLTIASATEPFGKALPPGGLYRPRKASCQGQLRLRAQASSLLLRGVAASRVAV